jgi:hypothetical protein
MTAQDDHPARDTAGEQFAPRRGAWIALVFPLVLVGLAFLGPGLLVHRVPAPGFVDWPWVLAARVAVVVVVFVLLRRARVTARSATVVVLSVLAAWSAGWAVAPSREGPALVDGLGPIDAAWAGLASLMTPWGIVWVALASAAGFAWVVWWARGDGSDERTTPRLPVALAIAVAGLVVLVSSPLMGMFAIVGGLAAWRFAALSSGALRALFASLVLGLGLVGALRLAWARSAIDAQRAAEVRAVGEVARLADAIGDGAAYVYVDPPGPRGPEAPRFDAPGVRTAMLRAAIGGEGTLTLASDPRTIDPASIPITFTTSGEARAVRAIAWTDSGVERIVRFETVRERAEVARRLGKPFPTMRVELSLSTRTAP